MSSMASPLLSSLPLVVEIKRFCEHDGPGLRSVVFFKGCPLRCSFCHNPETQSPKAELAFHASRCIRCGACVSVCKNRAISLDTPTRIHRENCRTCGACANACPSSALRIIGRSFSLDELLGELLRDEPFFRHSGGGVTLSGGECTLYLGFCGALARRLRERKIHVAIQTCGHFEWDGFSRELLPFVDWIFYDVKLKSPSLHRQVTGICSRGIERNLALLLTQQPSKVHARIPLVPGLTDGLDNLTAIARFLVDAGARTVSLLPYNPLGSSMYEAIGRTPPALPYRHYTPVELARIHRDFSGILGELLAGQSSRITERPSGLPELTAPSVLPR